MIRVFVLVIFFVVSSFSFDKIYFLPDDADDAKDKIVDLIKDSDETIDIAMYNLSYKKFVKALKKAQKKGIKITLFNEKSDLKLDDDFKVLKTKRKQHIKLAIIDSKYAIWGSANWTKKSFGKNYEIINITDDRQKVKKFMKIFKQLKDEN